MPKSKQQKSVMIDIYVDKLKNSKAVYIVESSKIKASQATDIKKNLYDLDSNFNVVKNRLFKIALEKSGYELPAGLDEGQHGIVFAGEKHLTESAKVIKDFLDTKNKEEKTELKIVGGLLDKKVISANEVISLATLPNRDQLIAQVVGTMNAPISGFVRVTAGTLSGFMTALTAIKDKKSE